MKMPGSFFSRTNYDRTGGNFFKKVLTGVFACGNGKSRQKMVIFLGNTNSGDQNFLNPFIYHRDTSHYMVLKKIGVTSSGPFAPILTNTPVKCYVMKLFV